MPKQGFPIAQKLRRRLLLALAAYVLGGFLLVLALQYALSLSQHPVILWLYWRLDILYILYLVAGLAVLFDHYWRKPWAYLQEVLDAAQLVHEQNDHTIRLSEPLREAEGQLNQLKMSVLLSQQAAKEAEDKKNEVVMYLAHDIRTPLTTVIGYLSLLDEAPDLPPPQRAKYIGVALDKAERLEALINELFEITRYHSHIVTLHRQLVDLSALLSQVLDDFYPVLSAKGNTAQLAVHDELTISADPEKLARVFGNLLKNAAAYSYPRTAIHTSVLRSGDRAQIAFTNCGPTIAAEDLTAIFDKFSRLDQARLSDTGGAGLGLSIAQEIIRLHGGEITAQSRDETITLTITLPLRPIGAIA